MTRCVGSGGLRRRNVGGGAREKGGERKSPRERIRQGTHGSSARGNARGERSGGGGGGARKGQRGRSACGTHSRACQCVRVGRLRVAATALDGSETRPDPARL